MQSMHEILRNWSKSILLFGMEFKFDNVRDTLNLCTLSRKMTVFENKVEKYIDTPFQSTIM